MAQNNISITPKNHWGKTLASFMLVLLMMPLGHAMMIVMEHTMTPEALNVGAFLLGFIGMVIVIVGVFIKGETRQTLCGLIGGLLFWAGWVEFLFAYYAARYGTHCDLIGTGVVETISQYVDGQCVAQEFTINGEALDTYTRAELKGIRASRPEYLILPASFGFWMIIMMLYIFCTANGCLFISWIQRKLFGKEKVQIAGRPMTRHVSMVTFMELVMIFWTSYLLLMFCYDKRFLGDIHPITLIIGVGCLIAAFFMFKRELKLSSWGANIRMAIATTVVFWTPVEIMGRNNIFKEIWVHPMQYQQEMYIILASFLVIFGAIVYKARLNAKREKA